MASGSLSTERWSAIWHALADVGRAVPPKLRGEARGRWISDALVDRLGHAPENRPERLAIALVEGIAIERLSSTRDPTERRDLLDAVENLARARYDLDCLDRSRREIDALERSL